MVNSDMEVVINVLCIARINVVADWKYVSVAEVHDCLARIQRMMETVKLIIALVLERDVK